MYTILIDRFTLFSYVVVGMPLVEHLSSLLRCTSDVYLLVSDITRDWSFLLNFYMYMIKVIGFAHLQNFLPSLVI